MRKIWRTKYEPNNSYRNFANTWLEISYIVRWYHHVSPNACTRVSSRHWRGNRSEQMLHAWFPGSRPNLFQWRGMGVGIGIWCVLDESFVLRSQCDPEKESLAAPFWTMSKSALALFQVSSNPSLYMDHGSWMVMGHLILALIWRFNMFRYSCRNANSQEPGHWASLQSSTILMKTSHGLADWNGHCQLPVQKNMDFRA